MKEKISKEKILEYFERESGDRLLDRFEYAERVIFPAMEQYARQFLNPVVADNIFELIGQGIYKINCCELTIGGLADQVEGFVNQEVEKRIAEKMVEERLRATTERCKKLEFMIENGLGWEDMRNDITMPHEI